jgi:hypothetical protein
LFDFFLFLIVSGDNKRLLNVLVDSNRTRYHFTFAQNVSSGI